MIRLLTWCGRYASWLLVAGIVLALVLPQVGAVIEPAFPIIVVAMMAVAMVRVDLTDVLGHIRRPLRLIGVLVMLMVLIPVAVHAAASALGVPAEIHTMLILLACGPPLVSSPNLAYLLRLDAALTLNLMVAGTLATPVIAPPLITASVGLSIDLDAGWFFVRLVLIIAVAILLAAITRRVAGRQWIVRNALIFDGLSALLMIVFAVAVMSSVGREFAVDPVRVLIVLAVAAAANFGLQAVVGLGLGPLQRRALRLDRRQVLSVGLIGGNRNMALFLAAMPGETAGPMFLFLALYQIPMYLTPLLAGPVYRRLLRPRT